MAKKTLGKLPREAIRMLELPRVAPEIIEGFRNLIDFFDVTWVTSPMYHTNCFSIFCNFAFNIRWIYTASNRINISPD